MCLMGLKEIQKYWKINNNILDLFLDYLDDPIVQRLRGKDPDSPRERPVEHNGHEGHSSDANAPAVDNGNDASQSHFPEHSMGQTPNEALGSQYINAFQPRISGLGDGFLDLGLYLDTRGAMDNDMQFEGLNFLQRAL